MAASGGSQCCCWETCEAPVLLRVREGMEVSLNSLLTSPEWGGQRTKAVTYVPCSVPRWPQPCMEQKEAAPFSSKAEEAALF